MTPLAAEPNESAVHGEHVWAGGWWGNAVHRSSPHHGPRPVGTAIDLIVVHSISLPPGECGGPHIDAFFRGRLDAQAHPYFASLSGMQVSAHFVITRAGAVHQYVDVRRRAWHAGVSSHRGRPSCNDFSVGIELEGLEGERFEAPQYHALATLCQSLAAHWPIADIAGHEHIAPGRKADPGVGFDWDTLKVLLRWPDRCFPG
jgi:N-acetyl-anhydromuramoyl-L-alanine amidase